ncbi:hypothetical protein ACEWY4_018111 [Coilia grayii]|uniref:Centriolar and ciliogenesis-associated protein HYLS1 C-terminal domain-containing protein n=1 Tax=Coilia grayii TaxID=363190 RepID=A0ABD1JIR2_9TELE
MYRTLDSTRDSDCDGDANSSGSSFWSDQESEAEDGRHHAVESEEEVLERYVSEQPGGTRQDKHGQLGEQVRDRGHDNHTQGRQQSRQSTNTKNKEEYVGKWRGDEADMKSDCEEQTETDDHGKSTDDVKEDYEDDRRCSSEREQQKADTHQSITDDRPIVETAFKFVTSAEKAQSQEAQAQRHWYEKENVRICMEEDRSEKDAEQDYPIAASPTTSVMTSGYGTYRPDSPRDTADGEAFQDDITLTDPEEDSDVGQFDAQYYVDNYRLSLKDNEFSRNAMLCDDIGNNRNQSNSQALPDYSNNSTGVDHEYVGLRVVSEGLGIQCSVDDSHRIDKANEGESQYRDDQVSELRKPYSRKTCTASEVKDVPLCEKNDFTSQNREHPYNLRQNKWKYYQRRKLKGTEYIRKKTRHKKSGVSGLEECLDRLEMSEMQRRQAMEMESEELESLSSGGELPSAYRDYFRGIVRSRSESDIRPRPKSFIRPLMDHPHTRNLKKTDPVTKYFQYKEEWDAFKAPGEKDRRALRWEIREQLAYQPPPPRPQKVLIPNTYVVPTDKKRSALRWVIRHDLANGIIPTKTAFP